MATHAAFLRGINVGGHHKVPMKDLRALLATLGLQKPGTLLASGNAWFEAGTQDSLALQARLSQAIEARFGFAVPTVVCTAEQVRSLVRAGHPFADDASDPKFLHVCFLSAVPQPDPDRRPDVEEPMEVRGDVLFVHYVNGVARSKLTMDRIERWLGVQATGRNWNTVRKIAEKLG